VINKGLFTANVSDNVSIHCINLVIMKQVTVKDLADKLNLHFTTVARALRDHPDVSPETKKKVLALAKKLDYYPNFYARGLLKDDSKTIGVIVPEIKHDFFSSVISGIEDLSSERGFTIMVCQSNESFAREIQNINSLISKKVDGILVSLAQDTKNCDHFRPILKRKIPLIFFDRVPESLDATKVVVDDFRGAFEAVSHLAQRGYENIAHISGPKNLAISHERERGYKEALKHYALNFDENMVVSGGLWEEDGKKGVQYLLKKNKKIDALFAVNDPVAIGAYQLIKKMGLHIPDDIALVGFSNNPITAIIDPALTTVNQPSYEMGRRAAELLFYQIDNGDNGDMKKEVLRTKLIIRQST
jgi:DNA-binding LacI/PurR family transcriptional regulator